MGIFLVDNNFLNDWHYLFLLEKPKTGDRKKKPVDKKQDAKFTVEDIIEKASAISKLKALKFHDTDNSLAVLSTMSQNMTG